MQAAFAWLDVRASRTSQERSAWLALIRKFLEIVLSSIPIIQAGSRQEIDGLPSDFDHWVFKLVARAIPCLTATERPEDLLRPLLARGAPAHQWIEQFCWEWFTSGLAASPAPAAFVQIWRAMITLCT
jgi:hypothetical protein